jgi:hypothetical protein
MANGEQRIVRLWLMPVVGIHALFLFRYSQLPFAGWPPRRSQIPRNAGEINPAVTIHPADFAGGGQSVVRFHRTFGGSL